MKLTKLDRIIDNLFTRFMRNKGYYTCLLLLFLQSLLIIHLQRKYDALYSLATIPHIDTFWHSNNDASIIVPRKRTQVKFDRSFIIVTACARDVAKFLPEFRRNIEDIVSIFEDYRVLIGESDSKDATREYLTKWSVKNPKIQQYTYGNLTRTFSTRRTDRIAYCRNHLLTTAREKQWITRAQFLLVVDIDVNGNSILSSDKFLTNFHYDLNQWGAMTASQTHLYYDIWALRSSIVDYDCWKAVSKYPRNSDIAHKIFIDVHRKPIPKDHPLIPVQSAFGGFAVYQTRYLQDCRYDSFDAEFSYGKCEHVIFNECVSRNGGKIFVNPAFQNSDGLL
ncbi:unnamed protein product [Adineta ricciae]|uniref:Uncharacterized protein n=2 Tax=Adineta ricciae TaxID=249248 RepID=A0A814V893_ADIRI|nr:unnamed protein product [Adineta ricciae]